MENKSKKPKKQRKRFYSMKLHEKRKVLSAHLSKELRKKLKKRSLMVKKGDKVKILRGEHKKKEGKVTKVDHNRARVFVDKITRKKSDGTEIFIPLKASNLLLTEVDLSDAKRLKGKQEKPVEKTVTKKEAKDDGKKGSKQS